MNKYTYLALGGFILWFGETAVFGFNAKPMSNAEHLFDIISHVAIVWGVIGDILCSVGQKVTIEKNYHIKTLQGDVLVQRESKFDLGDSDES